MPPGLARGGRGHCTPMAEPPVPERALSDQTDERTARADWRSSIYASGLATLAGGIWLVVAPALISYDRPLNPVIWGGLVVFLSLLRLVAAPASRTLALTTAAAGILAVIAAFIVDEPPGATMNLALVGLGVAVVSLVGLGADEESKRRSFG